MRRYGLFKRYQIYSCLTPGTWKTIYSIGSYLYFLKRFFEVLQQIDYLYMNNYSVLQDMRTNEVFLQKGYKIYKC